MAGSMAGSTTAAVPAAPQPRGWIGSRGFDLALFTLSPLAGLAVVLATLYAPWGRYVGPAAVYFVAIPHYLSTFTFYLADDNRAYYKTRWVAFFVGPLICIAVVFAAILSDQRALYQTGQFSWNIFHVALQSVGILGLYRWLNGGPGNERAVAKIAILATSAAMAFYRLDRFPPMYETLGAVHPMLPDLLFPAALAVALPSLAMLAFRIGQRPGGIAFPEAAFLATSLLLFHPYLWVEDSELATLGMLMGHFVQYLAIVWLLHRRKYGVPSGSTGQRLLGYVGGKTPALLATLLATGAIVFAMDQGSRALGIPWAYQIPWNVLVIMHFYLDGLIWTFKRPYVRESFGPFLTMESHRRA